MFVVYPSSCIGCFYKFLYYIYKFYIGYKASFILKGWSVSVQGCRLEFTPLANSFNDQIWLNQACSLIFGVQYSLLNES